jgi:hypothetical protein
MGAARHLRPVPFPESGELPKDGPQSLVEALDIIDFLSRKLQGAGAQITKLERSLSKALAVEPEAEQILEVLSFWNDFIKQGRCKLVVGSERWQKVRARLREKDVRTGEPYTVLQLRAAVVGAKLSDFHVKHGYLDAATIFRDATTVDAHIARAVSFKRTYGASALAIVDELASEGLKWLAERCVCGHFRLDHVRKGPTPDLRQPCSACACEDFDWFTAQFEMYMVELRERAKTDPEAKRELEYGEWLNATHEEWRRKRRRQDEELQKLAEAS